MKTTTPVIEIDQLSKAYGKIQAVKDLSIRVEQGEIFGFPWSQWSGQDYDYSLYA